MIRLTMVYLKLNFKIIKSNLKNLMITIENTKGIKVFGGIFLLFNRILISHVITMNRFLKTKIK